MKLNIKLNSIDMYDFLMQHTYKHFSGIFGLILSFGALIGLFLTYQGNSTMTNVLLILTACLFTIVNPIMLYSKAAQQVKLTPMFQKPIEYYFNDKEISLSQEEQSVQVKWEEVQKVVETKRSIIIYLSAVRAYILPKRQYSDLIDSLKNIIKNNIDNSKQKLK